VTNMLIQVEEGGQSSHTLIKNLYMLRLKTMICNDLQVTTMLSHVEEVSKAPLPDQAELDTLRSNVAKQQQKVDQLSTPEPSANGAEVHHCCLVLATCAVPCSCSSCKHSCPFGKCPEVRCWITCGNCLKVCIRNDWLAG